MRIFIVIVLLLLVVHKFAYAQSDYNKNTALYSSGSVEAQVDRLNNIAHNIFLTSPDSAHKIASRALILSEKSNYKFGKGQSFFNLGIIYWSRSYYPVSFFYLKSALPFLPKDKPLYRSDGYRALARTYADLKDYRSALNNLDTSMNFAGNDAGRLAEAYSERSYIYCALNDYDKAIDAANYSLKLNKGVKADGNIAVLYNRQAVIYTNKINYRAALAYNDTALSMSIKTHNRRLRSYTYIQYALINNSLGKFDQAINYARNAIALSDSIGVMDAETKAFGAIVNSYELKGELKTALAWQKKYNAVRDSLNTINKLKTITLVQNYYALNSKMAGIALMRADAGINSTRLKSQQILIIILFSSLVILMVLLSVTYYFYLQKQSLGDKLQQHHEELLGQKKLIEAQATNLQKVSNLKDRLLTVIGHDLRAPIANLSNIVELFDAGYLTEKEVRDLMKNINPVVKGAELTLLNLIDWAGNHIKGRSIDFSKVDIFLLGVEMEQTFAHELHLKGIEFINIASAGQRVYADENHLKVILRNLIGNAIKFTCDKGFIKLSTIVENNELIISVEDSGKGMTADEIDKLFYLHSHFSNSGTSGETGTGIGLLLCKELIELNGGKLMVKSALRKGSTFYFNLPLIKTYA